VIPSVSSDHVLCPPKASRLVLILHPATAGPFGDKALIAVVEASFVCLDKH
jgi:hypothetical protein